MNVVAEMLLTEPAPVAIWATLIVLTFPALLLLGSPEGMRHPGRVVQGLADLLRERGRRRRRESQEAIRAFQYAGEVRVAADRATDAAQRWQERWEQAETTMNAAWQSWLDADARLRTITAAAAWNAPWSVRTCEEYAARERFLHRAVTAAADRGELPASAIADAVTGRNGWDARLHPVEQELVIARASTAWLRHRYDQAAAAERTAWHDADLARRAATSLNHEARTAADEAATLSARLAPQSRPTARATHRPLAVPAT
ncbi:hypothetical protein JIG36_03075 [Actinoplanes sp. LDG1-06]|uniref:Uncharacterized protein n=1 Tax=Paractinoplanes ovalisporus TaxID=2810368 RepID=A0ABS2A3W1_9ACTN|nr:hypothetical protein [Actinoplanes ovalisporus]MBM2614536.1 hypothetical protein [Actinoplanes ovalisporus]